MKELSEKEMLSVLGGFSVDYVNCSDLQNEANAHRNDPNFDWDAWADLWEKYCC